MRALLLTIALLLAQAAPGLAQQEETSTSRPIAETAERLAREMWTNDAPENAEKPVFRSGVTVDQFRLPPPWYPQNDDSFDARPRGRTSYHREYLEAVTPEEFRGSVLYPAGIGVDPAAIVNGIRSVFRGWEERRVRAQIAEELIALQRARAAAGLPPIDP